MSARKYSLIDSKLPVIDRSSVIFDPGVGGIKLTYEVSNEKASLTQRDKEIHVYLKPYKEYWGESKKDVGKGEWGNTNSPLANVWLKIKGDYTNYEKDVMFIRYDIVKDQKLISELNKNTKKFVVGSDENVREIPFKEKLIFKVGELAEKTKEEIKLRIFLR